LGDFKSSREQWDKIITTAQGDKGIYLETATVFWDYFQYNDALRVIDASRKKFGDDKLCAFETGVIRESLHDKPAAIREYVAALGSDDYEQSDKAVRRLVKLTNANKLGDEIAAAFAAKSSQSQKLGGDDAGLRRLSDTDRQSRSCYEALDVGNRRER
jgi:hypothetical protein